MTSTFLDVVIECLKILDHKSENDHKGLRFSKIAHPSFKLIFDVYCLPYAQVRLITKIIPILL